MFYPKRVTQRGVIDIGLPDHQLIYCTRKIARIKRGSHKQKVPFISLYGRSFRTRAMKSRLSKLSKLQ